MKIIEKLLSGMVSVVLGIGTGISFGVTAISNCFFPYIDSNYNNNSRKSFEGFIFDQCVGDAASLKMGYYGGAYNGCGWIAAYNAALIKGLRINPADIIKFYEKRGGVALNGFFGVNPIVIKRFFRSLGINAKIYNFPSSGGLDELIKTSGAGVLAYAHKRGMHFVAIEHNDGTFRIYNEFSDEGGCACCSSVGEWLQSAAVKYVAISFVQIE